MDLKDPLLFSELHVLSFKTLNSAELARQRWNVVTMTRRVKL